MAVYCTQCGTALPPNARFCSNCGVVVAAAPPSMGRPLARPRTGRQIAGVCLALARAYRWDVTAVRIVAVITLVLSSGLIGIAYLAAWVGIPEEPPFALPNSAGVYPPGV
jgi:phage shock protein C